MSRCKKAASLSIQIFSRWIFKDGVGKAAAVSFYTLFSAAPLMFFSLIAAQLAVGTTRARDSAVTWLGGFISEEEAASLVELIGIRFWSGQSLLTSIVIGLVLLWATSLVFVRIRLGVRDLFDERAEDFRTALRKGIFGRIFALSVSIIFGMATAAGFVLVSTLPSMPWMVQHDSGFVGLLLRNTWPAVLLTLGGTLLIRWIPDNPPGWSPTLRAASFMVVFYTLGRLLMEIYMQHSTIASAYGAASALVIFLVWTYFAAQVFFFACVLAEELDALHR